MRATEDVPARAPRPSLLHSVGVTGATSAAILLVNMVSGVLIARLLDPAGKGAVAAIVMWIQMGAWAFAMGLPAAATYLLARRSELGRQIVGTALVASAAFGAVAVGATQLLLLVVFADQPDHVRTMAHVFAFGVVIIVFADLLTSVVTGDHDFGFLNVLRFGRQALKVVLFLALWPLLGFTVGSVLVAFLLAEVVVTAAGAVRVVRRIGVARPSLGILRSNLRYGLRLQGAQLAGAANHRLDLLIMPAFLATSAIGLYSVAVSVAAIVFSVVGTAALVVFPAATSAGPGGGALVSRSLRLVLLTTAVCSIPVFLLAPVVVPLLYGGEFAGAVTALRILLLGYAFKAGSAIIGAGLNASNRPLAASAAQITAIPVTVGGLLLVLGPYGIEGAALVSTAAYGLSFVVGLVLLAKGSDMPIKALLSVRDLGEDLRLVRRRAHRTIRRRAGMRRSASVT